MDWLSLSYIAQNAILHLVLHKVEFAGTKFCIVLIQYEQNVNQVVEKIKLLDFASNVEQNTVVSQFLEATQDILIFPTCFLELP